MFTSSQIIAHFFGDYISQSNWMANSKTSSFAPAMIHAFLYTIAFVFITQNIITLLLIMFSHFLVDRYRLSKYVCFAKNFLAPRAEWRPWSECSNTGYPDDMPQWLSVWLMIIADNTIHLITNGFFIWLDL